MYVRHAFSFVWCGRSCSYTEYASSMLFLHVTYYTIQSMHWHSHTCKALFNDLPSFFPGRLPVHGLTLTDTIRYDKRAIADDNDTPR